MYSRITAVLLNSIFGICLVYAGIVLWFMLDIFYNRKRYQKRQPFILLAVPFTAARIDHHDIGQGILLYY